MQQQVTSAMAPSSTRPVVAVKLPQPGQGQARVGDVTAGSGRANPAEPSHQPSPASEQNFSSLPQRLRTPEIRRPEDDSLNVSPMQRSNSENVLARSKQEPAVTEAEVPNSPAESSYGSPPPPLKNTWGLQETATAEDQPVPPVQIPLPAQNQKAASQVESLPDPVASARSELPSVRSELPSAPSAHSELPSARSELPSARSERPEQPGRQARRPSADPPKGPRSWRRGGAPDRQSSPRQGRHVGGRERDRTPVAGRDRTSNSSRPPDEQRSQSEPPRRQPRPERTPRGGQLPMDSRLPKLIGEIENHLLQKTAKPPSDASEWLKETAQLELFAEEMRWLIKSHQDLQKANEGEGSGNVRARDISVFRGDKDLQWAQQQLRNCEWEHAHLQQMLGNPDLQFEKERLVEIREVEKSIEAENQRMKQLQAEARRRERTLARAAERAAGGDFLGGARQDGNARAVQQAKRLEAELDVWEMKNDSLKKQIKQIDERLKQVTESREQLGVKQHALQLKLESDEAKQWIEQQKKQEEQQHREERQLRKQAAELRNQRQSRADSVEHKIRGRSRHVAELKRQQMQLESHLVGLKFTEQQLRRQIKQAEDARRAEARLRRRPEASKKQSDEMAEQIPEAEITIKASVFDTEILPDEGVHDVLAEQAAVLAGHAADLKSLTEDRVMRITVLQEVFDGVQDSTSRGNFEASAQYVHRLVLNAITRAESRWPAAST
eukprot:TRINITY_DN19591_c0_g1_i4.p1 TRINITY_DN19591_c0_g1~~TRINITY_DN19591_c0_g1_i4.p1  ORF type:complete len:725 (+),score=158.96 TRINITY_DN19591_c0_g1_i4:111-2285(+)